MRVTRLLTAALSVALLGLPAYAVGAGPAAAEEVGETRLLVERRPRVQVFGGDVQVAGRLDLYDGTGWSSPGEGHVVTLERRRPGQDGFVPVAEQATDADGLVAFLVTARSNARFRLSYEPDGTAVVMLASRSAQVASKVMRDLGAREPRVGRRIVWKGNVDPGWGNRSIVLQRRTCRSCAWKDHDRTRTKRNGSWTVRVGAPAKGSWWFRTKVRRTEKFVTSYSAVLRTYRS